MRFLAVLIWFGAFGIAIAEVVGTKQAIEGVTVFVWSCGGLAALYDTLVELEGNAGERLAILAVRAVIFFGGFGLTFDLAGGNAYLAAAMTLAALTAVFLYGAKGRALKDFFSFGPDEPSDLDKAIKAISSGEVEKQQSVATIFDTRDVAVLADLCGHHKAVITSLIGAGSRVQKGDVVAKFEVKHERLQTTLGLTEYARRDGTIELLVSLGQEIFDKQPIYRLGD